MVLTSKNKKNSSGGVLFSKVQTTDYQHDWKWVLLIHFAIETYCPCYQITRSIAQYGFYNWLYWSLKLTQHCRKNCVTTCLLLTNHSLVHSGQYLLFLTARRERQALLLKHVTFHLLSRLIESFDLNKNWGFV